MSIEENPAISNVIDGLKQAALLLNRNDLRSASLSDARSYNAAEQAVRAGIAAIEQAHELVRISPLTWDWETFHEGEISGDILVARALGLRYQIAETPDGSGWTWLFGIDSGFEPTEEAARAFCQRDFEARIRLFIQPAQLG